MKISDLLSKALCSCCFGLCLIMTTNAADLVLQKVNEKPNNSSMVKLPSKWIYRKTDNVLFPILENMQLTTSRHVAFTDEKPLLPPSSEFQNSYVVDIDNMKGLSKERREKRRKDKKQKRKNRRKNRKRNHRLRHSKSRLRSKRSHVASEASSVCTTVSKWVAPSGEKTSYDQWEQPVTILPHLVVDGRRIQQYIYETSCLEDNIPCKGIDKKNYRSECITKKVYAYAYVRNSQGEEGWSYVQINGYCNCKLHRKHHNGPRNILDYLSHLK